ncbi:hypothetical protein JXA47_09380 [Candidatus Sumerlaeota bacterium]|nr:hypothetical protein [Candidatus Sumerlaeota bacterium]
MRHVIWALAITLLAGGVLADPYPTDRDRIISEADTFHSLEWYCSSSNIYVAGSPGYENAECDYSTPGWYTNMPYKWGGYDTVDGFLDDMALGRGAGDIDTSGTNSNCSGVDCSGYVSRTWESGRYSTATFANASFPIDWEDLRMGDALNRAGSHIRLFIRWEDASTLWVYEATAGAGHPWRVVKRTLPITSFSGYIPIRYDLDGDTTNFVRIDDEPTVQWVVENGLGNVWIPFDGEASDGFRLQHSTDGSAWATLQTEATLGSAAFRADVSGVSAGANHFYRVCSVNSGVPTAWSDTLAYRQPQAGGASVLIVDGIDRWRTQGGDNPGHTFLVPVAESLGRLGYGYESCSNEMVAAGMIDLSDYDVVIWLLAEESTFDETVSRGEQFHIEDYLEGGGNLFISGSEMGWDLDHLSPSADAPRFWDVTDEGFMLDYLKFDLDDDGTGGNGYVASGVASTPMDGLSIHFDDGTHGTYDVAYPDCYALQGSAEAWLTYPGYSDRVAMGAWEGMFGSGVVTGCVVTMGFGLEAVYTDSERDDLLLGVMTYFGAAVPVELSVFAAD